MFTGEMTTLSSGSCTCPPTSSVKLRRRSNGGRYDAEALIGSGLFLHISSMFDGGPGVEYWGLHSEATLKAVVNLGSSPLPGECIGLGRLGPCVGSLFRIYATAPASKEGLDCLAIGGSGDNWVCTWARDWNDRDFTIPDGDTIMGGERRSMGRCWL